MRVAGELGEARDYAFARHEHLIGRDMTRNPFSAPCGCDRTSLGLRVEVAA